MLAEAHEVYGLVLETPGAAGESKDAARKATRIVGSAYHKWEAAETLAIAMENRMDIAMRWLPTDPEYIAVIVASGERTYRRALDEIEQLIVQRLFELAKLNLMSTGKI